MIIALHYINGRHKARVIFNAGFFTRKYSRACRDIEAQIREFVVFLISTQNKEEYTDDVDVIDTQIMRARNPIS